VAATSPSLVNCLMHPIDLLDHHLLSNFGVDRYCHASSASSWSWPSPLSASCIHCQRHNCLLLSPPLPFSRDHCISASLNLTTSHFCLSSHLSLLCRYIQESDLMYHNHWFHLPQMPLIHCASIPTSGTHSCRG
jgi:hypothetical protein